MKIELLLLGKTKDGYLQKGIDEYVKRLSRFAAVELITIKAVRHGSWSDSEITGQESVLIEKKIGKGNFRVVLDSRGRQYSSEAFAEFLSGLESRGISTATFIIGGPVFLSDDWDYCWVTPKGSSKEHGYVPHYGELAHQTATLYEITRDEGVKRQAVRMIAARAPFRVPSNDRDGNACIRIEAVIGWRHSWYPA